MYSIDWAGLLSRSSVGTAAPPLQDGARPGVVSRVLARPAVSRTVWCLGITSCFTDISSEMVASILPIYLVVHLHLTPLAFGMIDGLYQGFAAVVRVAGGFAADRWHGHKAIAAAGYGLSAACKIGLLAAGNAWGLLATVIALDRTGKGIRTAPRDALISLSSPREGLAAAFGVHRALDAAGAMLGPLLAFLLFAFLPNAFDVVFVVSFCLAMIGLGVLLFFVDGSERADSAVTDPGRQAVAAVDDRPTLKSAAALVWAPGFRRLLIAGALLGIATVSDGFVLLTLQRQLGFSTAYFPLLYVGVAGCNCLLSVPAGRIADRSGRWRTFLVGHILLLMVYGLLVTQGADFVRLGLSLLLMGAYYAMTDGVLTAMASAALPPRLTASGLAVLASVTNVARLLASVLFGAIWTYAGLTTALGTFAAGLALAIVAARLALRPARELRTGLSGPAV
jgi:MFS family permease